MSTYLLLDIGNSNIKVAISSNNRFKFIHNIPYLKNEFNNALKSITKNFKFPVKLAGISLTDHRLHSQTEKILKISGIMDLIFINKSIRLPIKFKYKSNLGSDRICGAVASSYLFPRRKYVLFIDFGTATTYNFIINKVFLGGMIAPGILTSLSSLVQGTALPGVKLSIPNKLVNKDTLSNIKAGVYFSSLYSFERIVKELRYKYKNLFVIITGGMSRLILPNTKLIDEVESCLVLKGIDIILKYNEQFRSK